MRALVTGASSGIGRDIARELSKRGYDLVIVARNVEKLEELKLELNTNVEVIGMDLSIEENCKKLYDKAPNIDILVNNAGFGEFGRFTDTDLDKEISLIKTNITALHILTKLYLQDMVKRNKGRILNVASLAGFLPGPLMATYYASKAYVVRLSEALREELKRQNSKVKISLFCPGPVKTNFNNVANVKFELDSFTSEYVAKYAVKRMLRNKFYIVPGTVVKLAKFFSKITPTPILSKCAYHMQKRKFNMHVIKY